MKYCLLFILICLISSQNENYCQNESNKDKCLSENPTKPKYKCCFYENSCFSVPLKAILLQNDIIYRAIQKEIQHTNEYKTIEYEMECQSGKLKLADINMELTDQEKEIVESNNYCLNYHNKVKNSNSDSPIKSKDNCFKAKILDSSNELGLECGFYNFTIISEYGQKTIQTCFLLNPSILSESTIDDGTKLIMDEIAGDLSATGTYSSYTSQIYSSTGISKIYDSTKETLEDIPNASKIMISKYLFLLFLILLL